VDLTDTSESEDDFGLLEDQRAPPKRRKAKPKPRRRADNGQFEINPAHLAAVSKSMQEVVNLLTVQAKDAAVSRDEDRRAQASKNGRAYGWMSLAYTAKVAGLSLEVASSPEGTRGFSPLSLSFCCCPISSCFVRCQFVSLFLVCRAVRVVVLVTMLCLVCYARAADYFLTWSRLFSQ
jgi:hypothetical protein